MTTFDKIPVVDISALGGRDKERHHAVIRELRDAAEHVGFLYDAVELGEEGIFSSASLFCLCH